MGKTLQRQQNSLKYLHAYLVHKTKAARRGSIFGTKCLRSCSSHINNRKKNLLDNIDQHHFHLG